MFLGNTLKSSGLNFTQARWTTQRVTLDNCFAREVQSVNIRDIGNAFDQFKNANVRLVVVVLPSPDAQTFSRVKHLADVKYGIHTLCVRQQFNKNVGHSAPGCCQATGPECRQY